MTYDALKEYLEQNSDEIMKQTGAHMVGIGKNADGEDILNIYAENPPTNQESKAMQKLFSDSVKIPFQYVVEKQSESDILYVNEEESLHKDYGRYRPLIGGIQVYLKNKTKAWFGTLGTFVKSKDSKDNKLYLLSNKHVLDSVNLNVYQPLPGDNNIIAKVCRVEEFNNTDAALAEVLNPSDVDADVIEEIGIITEIKKIEKSDAGKKVIKRGRTTIRTVGTIESTSATVRLTDGTVRYDCVIVRANKGELFSNSGDSGSPVVMSGEGKLVGLHFAGNQTPGGTSIFCKIDNVFENYNIKLTD
ncbi:MAG: hypothetical protein J1F22_02870 [Lachnospiraceae bacterium]|nr:hypothetical protein [Lachnospiraceae bacterium]